MGKGPAVGDVVQVGAADRGRAAGSAGPVSFELDPACADGPASADASAPAEPAGPAPATAPAGPAPADAASVNRFGKLSELRVRAEARAGKTAVPGLYASMPFKVMHPLRPAAALPGLGDAAIAAAPAQLMVMSVSAGIMAGDRQRVQVKVGPGAALSVTTQAFEKIHRMDDGASASRETVLSVGRGAYLDYEPLPQVPFAGSSFSSATVAELADASSRLVYGEILSCGRVARNERFGYRRYRNRVEVRVAGDPVFIDNTVYEPESTGGAMDMEGIGFYEGFTHLANLVLVNLGITDERFDAVRAYLLEQTGVIGASAKVRSGAAEDDALAGGITRLASGDCLVKLLGHRAQRLQQALAGVRALL